MFSGTVIECKTLHKQTQTHLSQKQQKANPEWNLLMLPHGSASPAPRTTFKLT